MTNEKQELTINDFTAVFSNKDVEKIIFAMKKSKIDDVKDFIRDAVLRRLDALEINTYSKKTVAAKIKHKAIPYNRKKLDEIAKTAYKLDEI